jgi:hypothetical protein
MFVVIASNILSMHFAKFKKEKVKPTVSEMEEAMFLKKFRRYDLKSTGSITVEVTLYINIIIHIY